MPADLLVRAAGFSPVKGTRHLARSRVQIDEQGPVGDRQWCLIDVSARRVVRTVQHPSLISVIARTDGAVLEIRLPGGASVGAEPVPTGETVTCDYWGRSVPLSLTEGPHASLLSDHLGQDVRLAAAPRGGVVFAAPVTMICTASLRALGEDVEASRFRATFVVETGEPWVEDTWLGTEVRVGDAVLRIGGAVPRCTVVDHHPRTGVKDHALLKGLIGRRPVNGAGEPMFGVYAEVVRPGVVEVWPPGSRFHARMDSSHPKGRILESNDFL